MFTTFPYPDNFLQPTLTLVDGMFRLVIAEQALSMYLRMAERAMRETGQELYHWRTCEISFAYNLVSGKNDVIIITPVE